MHKMTMRERMLAIIEGRTPDRVPFVQYDGCAAPNGQIWSAIGRGNMGVLIWSEIFDYRHPDCKFEYESFTEQRIKGKRTFLHTPKGTLTQESLIEPVYHSEHIKKYFVENKEDYDILLYYLNNMEVTANYSRYMKAYHDLGEDGIPMLSLSRTAFQQLWIQWVSISDLSLHMADYPDITEACIGALNGIQRKQHEIVRKASREIPIHYVEVPDNITAPVIGEACFRKYCMPVYQEFFEATDGNVPFFVHMDGDLKPLWKAIGETNINGIDSLSPPPDNDTSVGQALSMWPDMRFFVNFPSSVHLAGAEAIYAQTVKLLDEGGNSGRMWIQVSENVPPDAWRTSYTQIVRAIDDKFPASL